jgi:pyruvate kinase
MFCLKGGIMRQAEVVATLGPASSNKKMLLKMVEAGLDWVRINFSHGSLQEHQQQFQLIQDLKNDSKKQLKVMQDLEGFRIRVGRLEQDIKVERGDVFFLVAGSAQQKINEIPFDYHGSLDVFTQGSLIYIDDGKIVLEVIDRVEEKLKVKVNSEGSIGSRKGMNFPGIDLGFDSLSPKDRRDLKFGLENKVDFIAQSFVRNAADIINLKKIIKNNNHHPEIFAKIENQQALDNIDEIIDNADGVVVARGDLGVCVPIYKIAVIQKGIIKKSLAAGKPVLVATQLLDSMTTEVMPTRAEVTDVTNAIFDGATGLLLSAETAIGKHPHKVIEMINKIICYSEQNISKL